MNLKEKENILEKMIELSNLQEMYFEKLYNYGMLLIRLNKIKFKERR